MDINLKRNLYSEKFDPSEFMRKIVASGDIKSQLEESYEAVDLVKESATTGLRDNAFQYHNVILSAVHEIGTLERGLFELRTALLQEQETLVDAVERPETEQRRTSAVATRSRFKSARKSVFGLFSKIEGLDHSKLKERERYFIANKDLKEYDPTTFEMIHDLIIILFSDCMVLTLWTPHHDKHVYIQYKFMELIYFDKVRVEVFKPLEHARTGPHLHLQFPFIHGTNPDHAHVEHKMKFPFTVSYPNGRLNKLFDCESEGERDEWIATILRLSNELAELVDPRQSRLKSEFGDSLDNILHRLQTAHSAEVDSSGVPTWMREAATDIDDYIEMRELGDAVQLVLQVQKYWRKLEDWKLKKNAMDYYQACLEKKEKLVCRLLELLRCAMDCPFGFDRKMCVDLIGFLKQLNKTYNAGMLYLDHRTRIVCLEVDSIRPDSTVAEYVKERVELLFEGIIQTINDFGTFEFDGAKCRSAIVGWARFHVNRFVDQHLLLVFTEHLSMSSVADCVQHCRDAASKSDVLGIDLKMPMDVCLQDYSINYIDNQAERFVEKFIPANEDKTIMAWEKFQGKTLHQLVLDSAGSVMTYVEQSKQQGLGDILPYFEGFHLNVFTEIIEFGKVFLDWTNVVCKICNLGMRRYAEMWLARTATPAVQCIQGAVADSIQSDSSAACIYGSIGFIRGNIFNAAEAIFKAKFSSCNYLLLAEKDILNELNDAIKDKFLQHLTEPKKLSVLHGGLEVPARKLTHDFQLAARIGPFQEEEELRNNRH